MADDIKVSITVIKRLPKYHYCLGELIREKVKRVSSHELSKMVGCTASQIRQDLNNFGEFGQQGYGYKVEQLYREIANILGLNTTHKMVIVGAGNFGQALANYEEFGKYGFNVMALFDVNPKLIGLNIRGVLVLNAEEMSSYIDKNDVEIAVMAVPENKVEEVLYILSRTSIRGIWNLTPRKISSNNTGIMVENVHFTDNLFILSYRLNEESLYQKLSRTKRKKVLIQ